jgi:hypothetical protein
MMERQNNKPASRIILSFHYFVLKAFWGDKELLPKIHEPMKEFLHLQGIEPLRLVWARQPRSG